LNKADGVYLKADDFEVLQNNHPQPITNFSYINTPPATTPPALAAKAAGVLSKE
jgi:hypothetical protein